MIVYSRVIEVPADEPVSLSEAKTHLEYHGTVKETYIEGLIVTARRICEAYTGLSFVTQGRRIKLDRFPTRELYIVVPYGPVQTIDSFEYTDSDGATQQLTEGVDFMVDSHSGVCRLYAITSTGAITTWPSDVMDTLHPITIEYTAGYDPVSGGTEAMPDQLKQAILLQVGSMFENRQDEQTGGTSLLNWNSIALLDTFKVSWNAHSG